MEAVHVKVTHSGVLGFSANDQKQVNKNTTRENKLSSSMLEYKFRDFVHCFSNDVDDEKMELVGVNFDKTKRKE